MTQRVLCLITALAACLALPAMARENRALLIAAGRYDNLDQKYWLKGPANDISLVATYLATAAPVAFAPQHITVLTDDAEATPRATLAAIRTAFADLTTAAQPGDFVYIHFSGHGSQAPARNPDDELDGLDEMVMPVDIGPWSDTVGTVPNALLDDEVGQMLDALRAKGADVWVVFDSCHSGTATRAAPPAEEEMRSRQLSPDALAIPQSAMDAVQTRARPGSDPRTPADAPLTLTGDAGSVVAFFAAQTDEVTPEMRLPKGKPGRIPQGVFTYTLFETLAEYPGATYAQIGQEVLRKYAVKNLARATPMFEGDLDRVVFSGDAAPRVAQWPATVSDGTFTLSAGRLHGLGDGAVLAVMASAADPTSAALGYVRLTKLDTFTASGTAIERDGKTLPPHLPRGLTLRQSGDEVDFRLKVALPPAGTAPAAALQTVLADMQAEAGPRLTFVPADQDADLRLAVLPDSPRPDAIWVLPATGLAAGLSGLPSVSTADKDADELALALADTLTRMARATNLMKLGAATGSGGDMAMTVDLLTRNPADKALRNLPTGNIPRLIPQDEVHIDVANSNDYPVDLNVLYIGSDYSIAHMFKGRLQPGDRLRKGLLRITDEAYGRDRLVMVMTPALPQTAVEDLGFLAQDAVTLTRQGMAAPARRGLTAALFEAGFGTTTRAATSLTEDDNTQGPAPMILQFDLDTVPND